MKKTDFIKILADILCNFDSSLPYILCQEYYNVNRYDIPQEINEQDVDNMLSIATLMKTKPIQYIFNRAHFYGNTYYVDENVLIPRFDTENLVDLVIKENKNKSQLRILDCCTGSGIIAITLSKHLVNADVTASDISPKALKVAQMNAKLIGQQIKLVESNFLDKIEGQFDIIVSNPPYLTYQEYREVDSWVKCEPIIALVPSEDGLLAYENITRQAKEHLVNNGKIYFEIGRTQSDAVSQILQKYGFQDIKTYQDYSNNDRIVTGVKRG